MSFSKRDYLATVAKGLLADAQFCLNEAETQLNLVAQSETDAENLRLSIRRIKYRIKRIKELRKEQSK